MAFRLFRRIKIAPGITLNLSKSGLSASAGVRGARVTLGTPDSIAAAFSGFQRHLYSNLAA